MIRSSYFRAAAALAGLDVAAAPVRDMTERAEFAALFSFDAADDEDAGGLPPPPAGGRAAALFAAPAPPPVAVLAAPRTVPAADRPAVGALPLTPLFTAFPPLPFALAAAGSYPSRRSALSSPEVWSWKALSHWQNSRLS